MKTKECNRFTKKRENKKFVCNRERSFCDYTLCTNMVEPTWQHRLAFFCIFKGPIFSSKQPFLLIRIFFSTIYQICYIPLLTHSIFICLFISNLYFEKMSTVYSTIFKVMQAYVILLILAKDILLYKRSFPKGAYLYVRKSKIF